MAASSEHDALVAEFFALCERTDSNLYREVCERHIVLTIDQMKHRARREVSGSQLESDDTRREFERLLYSDSGEEDE